MRNINWVMCGLIMLISKTTSAITIEDMSEKNNILLELDQEIAIAEKSKKLAQLNNETLLTQSLSTQTLLVPQTEPVNHDNNMLVLSVHGSPSNLMVDVQYDGLLLHKRRGETLPNGWKLTAIGSNTVTFNKKIPNKPDIIKTINIGYHVASMP